MRLKDFNIVYQIARTELRVIFYSPVAWLILVVFAVQCGFSFCDVIWTAIKSQSLGYEVQALTGSVFTSGKGIFPVMLEHLYFYIPLLPKMILIIISRWLEATVRCQGLQL